MIKPSRKLKSFNICCFGVNHMGITVGAVIAQMCPFLSVTVVDMKPEKIPLWNTRQINLREKGLDEILKNCEGRNLIFSSNAKSTVQLADIVLICVNTSMKEKILDLTELEAVVRYVAQESENDKIIVVKSTTPVGTCENLKCILSANNPKNLRFPVLSIPIFPYKGRTVPYLLNPDKVLIGSDLSAEGIDAAETLESIYLQWVPSEKILKMNYWSSEFSKFAQSAFLAQRISTFSALSILCEKFDADIKEVLGGLEKLPFLGFGSPHLKNDLKYLIHMCKEMDLKESANYWQEDLMMNECIRRRFFNMIISSHANGIKSKKIAVWGVGFEKNLDLAEESMGTEMCMNILEEGAKLNVYDVGEKKDLTEELTALAKTNGLDPTSLLKNLTYYTDPYMSAYKVDIIVVCNELDAYKNIDFKLIYKDMIKPPYIFDGLACLPHEELIKIGFITQSIGKSFDSPDS